MAPIPTAGEMLRAHEMTLPPQQTACPPGQFVMGTLAFVLVLLVLVALAYVGGA
jgi:hypothetical protein